MNSSQLVSALPEDIWFLILRRLADKDEINLFLLSSTSRFFYSFMHYFLASDSSGQYLIDQKINYCLYAGHSDALSPNSLPFILSICQSPSTTLHERHNLLSFSASSHNASAQNQLALLPELHKTFYLELVAVSKKSMMQAIASTTLSLEETQNKLHHLIQVLNQSSTRNQSLVFSDVLEIISCFLPSLHLRDQDKKPLFITLEGFLKDGSASGVHMLMSNSVKRFFKTHSNWNDFFSVIKKTCFCLFLKRMN